jgi:hypothetical protein
LVNSLSRDFTDCTAKSVLVQQVTALLAFVFFRQNRSVEDNRTTAARRFWDYRQGVL